VTFKKILAATDFSARADHAVERAAQLAQQFAAELRVVHAMPDLTRFAWHIDRQQSIQTGIARGVERTMEKVCQRICEKYPVSPSWTVVYGRASAAIPEAQSMFSADLLVIGAQGESEPGPMRALGGTTLKLLPACAIPLLVVRRPVDHPYRRLMVALGDPAQSASLLTTARTLVGDGGCCVVHAFDVPYAPRFERLKINSETIDAYASDEEVLHREAVVQRLVAAGLDRQSEIRISRGDPRSVLLAEIERHHPELVILGKHTGGAEGSDRIGSLFLRLAYGADSDLLRIALDTPKEPL
jgi:nucleotide-binding universal stress UspA family protein